MTTGRGNFLYSRSRPPLAPRRKLAGVIAELEALLPKTGGERRAIVEEKLRRLRAVRDAGRR